MTKMPGNMRTLAKDRGDSDLPLAASSPNHPPNNDSQLTRSGSKPEVQALRSRAGQVEGHHPIAVGQ